jgi:Uma2 family endonuclease
MTSPLTSETVLAPPSEPLWIDDIPILYEDEEEEDMGESNPHVLADEILHVCLKVHMLRHHPKLQVFSNMNLYYRDGPPHRRTGSRPYVSPDSMVVEPYTPLEENVKSYTIGRDGPAPVATAEVLSERSAQQRDLNEKMVVYARLGVAEYILVNESGKFLPERLLLKRLQADGTYKDEKDADGGVTSKLGFRVILEADGLRVIDTATGQRYVRPMEAEAEAVERRRAEERLRAEEEARRDTELQLRVVREELRAEQAESRDAKEKIRALQEELARLKGRHP